MVKTAWLPQMGWIKSLALGLLVVIWVTWILMSDSTGTVISSLPFHAGGVSSLGLRPLVLYAYAESDNARENLAFFIKNGLHGNADFVFIFNGETSAVDLVPQLPNVRVVQRDNKCFDIGAMGQVLRNNDLWKGYRRFITMNASIRGPFFPVHSRGCWTETFLNRITDEVKLVGTSLNCHPRMHIQSMLLATDDVGMSILLDPSLALSASVDDFYGTSEDPVGFSSCFSTLHKAVHAEIGITSLIQSQGYDVDVVMTAPHSAANFQAFCDRTGSPDDFLYKDSYLGTNVHPYETVFMKANRKIDPVLLERLTEWHLAGNMSSWESCRP